MFRTALALALVFVADLTAQTPRKGFVVHEWGVFRVNTDAQFANADLRAEWDDLPEFVYGGVKGRNVPQHWGAVESRRKPIIFFHAEQPLTARVQIDFPGGQAGVWFPATQSPAVFGIQKQPEAVNSLSWELAVKAPPNGWQPKNQTYLPVREKHWASRIREVKSDDIFAKYSPNFADVEREKFLYYDGIFPQGNWLKIDVKGDAVALSSQVKRNLFDVTVVDRRGDDKVRIGRLDVLKPEDRDRNVAFKAVDGAGFSKDAAVVLLKQLTAAGLYEDEARSLVDLWKGEMFETPGLNLFYRLPQEEYDARLPLFIEPKPEKTVRVGLVYHARLEPDFADRILGLVKQLDSPRFAVRDAAIKKLHQTGPAAMVQLMRILERKDLSPEVRSRVDQLIKKWNVKDALERE